MREFIRTLRPRLGRIAGIVVSLLIIAGFTFVLLQIATGGPVARGLVSDEPTATTPLFTYETPTSTPLDAPPTPTFFAPGNATATPALSGAPFSVAAVEGPGLACQCSNSTGETTSGSFQCPAQMNMDANLGFLVADGAPGGTATYRWMTDLGPASPIMSINLQRGEGYNDSNIVEANWSYSAALGDGSKHWVWAEVLTPNHVVGQKAWYTFTCEFGVSYAVSAAATPGSYYDCDGPFTQQFPFTGTIYAFAVPAGHTITYHWLRSDGTTSPSYTIDLPAVLTPVTVANDTLSLSRSSQPNPHFEDEIIVDSPLPWNSPYVESSVFMPSCPPSPQPSPTPILVPTPTPTMEPPTPTPTTFSRSTLGAIV